MTIVLSVLASMAFAAPAFADVPPPNFSGCNMKAAGDACQKDDATDGSCVAETCTKLDYSMGSPPTSVEYACVLCNGPAGGGTDDPPADADDGGCAVKHGAAAGAAGAWALGAALLFMSRRARSRSRKPRS